MRCLRRGPLRLSRVNYPLMGEYGNNSSFQSVPLRRDCFISRLFIGLSHDRSQRTFHPWSSSPSRRIRAKEIFNRNSDHPTWIVSTIIHTMIKERARHGGPQDFPRKVRVFNYFGNLRPRSVVKKRRKRKSYGNLAGGAQERVANNIKYRSPYSSLKKEREIYGP